MSHLHLLTIIIRLHYWRPCMWPVSDPRSDNSMYHSKLEVSFIYPVYDNHKQHTYSLTDNIWMTRYKTPMTYFVKTISQPTYNQSNGPPKTIRTSPSTLIKDLSVIVTTCRLGSRWLLVLSELNVSFSWRSHLRKRGKGRVSSGHP